MSAPLIVQFCWTTADDAAFEQVVPLAWHGHHLRQQGWSNGIVLCFLEGLDRLSPAYRAELERLGYHLVDGVVAVTRALARHPQLRAVKTTSRFWFLRWNVLGELVAEHGGSGAIHLDGDVVLMADPAELARDVTGKTFVLQGCPAFTVIHDPSWYDVWETELDRLLADRGAYLQEALRLKAEPLRPDREWYNLCAYGPGRFEDQDLIEYLVAAGRLPQARTAEAVGSRFYWIQNPLFPGDWFAEQADGGGDCRIHEQDGLSYVGYRQVALYHLQTDFTSYCSGWLALNSVGMEQSSAALLRRSLLSPRYSPLVRAALGVLGWNRSRRQVCEAVFAPVSRGGRRLITDIVNSCWG
ncbi:hypothetical protein RHDC3_02611 [Rhodocyclaceae bacterium]|nr:hypothetical protein RHDC3_02611 [Rhodocyclaceae bacterium]